MKKYFNYLVVFFITCSCFWGQAFGADKEEVIFSKCIDGDTAQFLLANEIIKVRFLAIDTPETVHPTKEIETYGKEASNYTCDKIKNAKKIELEYDPGSNKLDKYGRALAWVWVDDSLLQKELIMLGYAKVAYLYGTYLYTDELYESQTAAQNNLVGMWGEESAPIYTVTFDEDGNSNLVYVLENNQVDYYIPEKDGYTFKYWAYKNKEFDFTLRITKDLTLSAVYEKEYTITEVIIILAVITLLYFTNQKSFKKKLKKLF